MGSLSLLQGIFPTQESNWGLLHCRLILYQLSYEGSPVVKNPPANAGDIRDACKFHLWVRKISWRRKWPPTPVSLPGESHEHRSLAGYSPRARSQDTTEQLSTAQLLASALPSQKAGLSRTLCCRSQGCLPLTASSSNKGGVSQRAFPACIRPDSGAKGSEVEGSLVGCIPAAC